MKLKCLATYHPAAVLRQWEWRPVMVNDLRRAVRYAREEKWPSREQLFHVEPSLGEVLSFIRMLRSRAAPFACDIETVGHRISIIGLSCSPDEAMVIPFYTMHKEGFSYWSVEEEHMLLMQLRGLLEDRACGVIGQNFHYDAQHLLRQWGIYPHVVDDTSWMQHVLYPGTPKSLDYLASLYCRVYRYWKDELKDYKRLPADEIRYRSYNGRDCCYTYEVWQTLKPLLAQQGVADQYAFQMSLFDPVMDMMVRGVRVNGETQNALALEIETRQSELESNLTRVVGHQVGASPDAAPWYRSDKQKSTFFHYECGVKPTLNRKTGKPTLDDEALAKIAVANPLLAPICDWLTEYSSLKVYRSTFLDAGIDDDQRVRCSFNVAGTETYRFSSSTNVFGSGLNLQNIPRDTALNVKAMFVPDPGHVFVDIDLSGADFRVAGYESNEIAVQQMFDAGLDPYLEAAKEFYNDRSITKKDPRRQLFKSACHGSNYAAGAKTLSAQLGLAIADVERVQRWWFARFPAIRNWHKKIESDLRTTRRVRNAWGYRRIYFDRIDALLPQALAWVCQSCVAITINKALINVVKNVPWAKVLLQVHDSLLIQIPIERKPEIPLLCRQCLIEIPYKPRPLIIPVSVKTSDISWGHVNEEAN